MSSIVVHGFKVGVHDFMAEVATNDKFSGLYISTYGDDGKLQQQQQHQQHQQQQQQQQLHQQQQQHHEQQQQQQQQQQQHEQTRDECGMAVGYDNLDSHIEYADSLARCGRVCESLELYARCFRLGPLPANCLWHVTTAFLELIRLQTSDDGGTDRTVASHHRQQPAAAAAAATASASACSSPPSSPPSARRRQLRTGPFDCGACNLVLRDPVTLLCGHTFCHRCAGAAKPLVCHTCGTATPYQPQSNVLVKSLVEKLWSPQVRASELLDEGKALYAQDKLHSALLKFNQAYYTSGENYDLLNIRSRTLLKLGLPENALSDAVRVVQMRPKWPKGRFTRGMALFSLGRYQEALMEFSLSAVLGENQQKLKSKINEVLQRLLILYSKEIEVLDLERWNSISHGYLRSYFNTFINGSNIFENNTNSLIVKPLEHENTSFAESSCEVSTITILVRQILAEIMHFKHYTSNVQSDESVLSVDTSLLDESDFSCVLCCGMFKNPVTTPCGHTYCMDCLEHSFDYSFHCPLCYTALPSILALSKKHTVQFVDELMRLKCTERGLARMASLKPEQEHDNAYMPVFVCTNAFPSVSCPLHVFEPRYRLMIRRCIESGTRRFAMVSNCCVPTKFAEYGTVLEIKDRIMMGNGCSFLSTVGTQRFKVLVTKEQDGYDMAKVQYIQDEKVPSKKLSELRKLHDNVRQRGLSWFNGFRSEIKSEIQMTVGFPPATELNWEQLADGPAWTWWLLSLLPLGPIAHVNLLANTSIEVRLKVINKMLNHIERSPLSQRII